MSDTRPMRACASRAGRSRCCRAAAWSSTGASSRPSAAAAISCPAPSPKPRRRSAAPCPNSPSPPPAAALRWYDAFTREVSVRRGFVAVLALSLTLATGAAWAAKAPGHYEGVLGGAEYWIDVPPDWNGGLGLYGHGWEGEGPGSGTLRGSPIGQHVESRGYASAASGYRAKGYRPDWFLLDLLALKAHFANQFGEPRWTIVYGQSMGGHIAISTLELHPDAYQGALV